MSEAEAAVATKRDPFKAPDVRPFALDTITLPQDGDTQLLAGVIFAEASPDLTDDDERFAIGWAFVNSVAHTQALRDGLICPALQDRPKQLARTKQIRADTANLGDSILGSIKSGSLAYDSDRWDLVMESDALKPIEQLKALPVPDLAPLRRAILVAVAIQNGERREENKYVMRFNRAKNEPPSARFESLMRRGSHTFYQFKAGRECG